MQLDNNTSSQRGNGSMKTAGEAWKPTKAAPQAQRPKRKKSESELDALARARAAAEGMAPPAPEVDEAIESPELK